MVKSCILAGIFDWVSGNDISQVASLRSWRDFVLECFCFGSEAVNASGDAAEIGGSAAARPLTNPVSYAG